MKKDKICEGCGQLIVGFEWSGHCEDCLCPDCGTTLDTENERALQLCEDCEAKEEEEEDGEEWDG